MAYHNVGSPYFPRRQPPPIPRYGSEDNLIGPYHPPPGVPMPSTSDSPNRISPRFIPNKPSKPIVKISQKKQPGRKIKETVGVYENWTAILNYQSSKTNELTLRKGEPVQVLQKNEGGWWFGQANDRTGIFPSIYVAHKSTMNGGPFSIRPLEIDKTELKECEVIGIGGFGRVYRGIWRREEVALKKVIRELRETAESARERVRREAKLLSLLRHPNIILLKGVCLQEPNMCLVMEYARGGSLFKVLRGQKLTLDVIVHWAIQIAKGMLYLHEEVEQSFRIKHIIHRDLKSHNILVYESVDDGDMLRKTLKITDFGQARQATQAARMSNAGTYAWAAPESVRDHQFSKYSDVWSYGVVLWEMLTGEVPYNGYEPLQILYAVGSFRRLPIPEKCPKVFQRLLKSCWEETPESRPLFSGILATLEGIEESPFVSRNMASFQSLQVQWHQEIQQKLEELRARDDELNERADAINQLLQKQQAQEQSLNRREQELYERELEVFEREITVMIREQNIDHMQIAYDKKRWKHKNPFKHLFTKIRISPPQDFVHVTEVTEVSRPHSPHAPRLQIINRPSPSTPLSEVSSPTDRSAVTPTSAEEPAAQQPNRKIGRTIKSPPSHISGKSIWYTDYAAQDISQDTAVLSPQVRGPKESTSSGAAVHDLQQGQVMDQASGFTSHPGASGNPLTLVMSRKPTIDYDPSTRWRQKNVEDDFQQMAADQNSPTYRHTTPNEAVARKDTAPRRPSTLDLVPCTTQMNDETTNHPTYQWGTMSVVIDRTPGKTIVKIGSTPTPSTSQNPPVFPSIGLTNRSLGASVPSLAAYSQHQVASDKTVSSTVVRSPALLRRDLTSQRVDLVPAASRLQLTNRNNQMFQTKQDQQSHLPTHLQSMFRPQM